MRIKEIWQLIKKSKTSSKFLLSAFFISLFCFSYVVFADPLYTPGETLEPTCALDSVDCGVSLPLASSSAPWTVSGNNVYLKASGNVGIGISNPEEKLHLKGALKQDVFSTSTLAGYYIDTSSYIKTPKAVFVSGNYAYVVSDGNDGFVIVDISDPDNLEVVGGLFDPTLLGGAVSVYVSGDYAYVIGNTSDSLAVIDVSDPTSPVFAGSLVDSDNLSGPWKIYVLGDYAYIVRNSANNLTIVDVSDPTSPILAGSLTDAVDMNTPYGIFVKDDYAYIASYESDNLAIVDVSDPTEPVLTGVLADATNMNGASNVYVVGDYAYLTARLATSFSIINISSSTNPTLEGRVANSTSLRGAWDVYVVGDYAYVAGFNLMVAHVGLTVVNISNPASPSVSGTLTNNSDKLRFANSVHVSGNYAYITGQNTNSLVAVNVSNPASPAYGDYLGNANKLYSGLSSVFVAGNYAYGGDEYLGNNNSFLAFDITRSESPLLGGRIKDDSVFYGTKDVYVSGDYAYMTEYDVGKLIVVDVSEPKNLTVSGLIQNNDLDAGYGITASGRYAYFVSNNSMNLLALDVSDPTSPVITGKVKDISKMNEPDKVFVYGDYAYAVGYDSNSLSIINISDPTNPVFAGSVSSSDYLGGANDVFVSGRYAYGVGNTSNSIVIIDIADPDNPQIVGSLIDDVNLNTPLGIYVSGDYAYVSCAPSWEGKITVIDVSDPTGPIFKNGLSNSDSKFLLTTSDVFISGRYGFAVGGSNESFLALDINGVEISSLTAGNLRTGAIDAWGRVSLGGDMSARAGLAVSGSIKSEGGVSLKGGEFIADENGKIGIGTISPQTLLDIDGSLKVGLESSCDSARVGTIRYYTSGNNSYLQICMQTGASSYGWQTVKSGAW